MLLVIDIGNTTIAFTGIAGEDSDEDGTLRCRDFSVLFEAKLPTRTGKDMPRFLREAERMLGQYGIPFLPDDGRGCIGGEKEKGMCRDAAAGSAAPGPPLFYLNGKKIRAVAVSSVVPAVTGAAVRLAGKICPMPPVVISCRSDSGLSFERISAPERVGTDRIADAAWAAARYPLPAMTADLGTATTINVIAAPSGSEETGDKSRLSEGKDILRPDALGIFLGGMIGAGVRTSLRALRAGTAQLPELDPCPVPEEALIGTDTDGCMLSSAIIGTAAQIEGLVSRVEEQLGKPVTLILTGGNAGPVAPWIRRPFIEEPSLASKGAAVIALRECLRKETGFQQ